MNKHYNCSIVNFTDMRFLTKNNIASLIVIFFTVLFPAHLLAQTSSGKSMLILVPEHKTQHAQEQLVSNLIVQKFFLSLKGYQKYQEEYLMNFTFNAPFESKDSTQLANYYIEQNYTNVVIINTQYNTNTKKYNVIIDFFYLGKKVENLKSTSFTTTFEDVFNALNILDVIKPEIFDSITQKLSKMLELFSRIHKKAILTFTYQDENTENATPYFVRINGIMIKNPSPKQIVVYGKKNFIEVLQENDFQEQVSVGSFVISPILDEYKVVINKKPKKEQKIGVFSKSKIAFLDSLVTTNLLLGYSNEVLSKKAFGTPHAFSGAVRVTFSPQIPLLALGIEVPFIIPAKEKSQEKSHSLLGLTALVSGVFPIAKNIETTIYGGGGFFSIAKLIFQKNIGKIKNDTQIQPQVSGGLGFAYNIPIKEAGYVRLSFNVSTTYSLLQEMTFQKDSNNSSSTKVKLQSTTHLLFINTSFGVGIRF